jgi:hypothetical protein
MVDIKPVVGQGGASGERVRGAEPHGPGKEWLQTKFIGERPWRPAVTRRQRGQRRRPGSVAGDSGPSSGREAQTAQGSASKPMRGRLI